jgi:hypothetical protein
VSRTIRLFISNTFREFGEERYLLCWRRSNTDRAGVHVKVALTLQEHHLLTAIKESAW